MVCYFARQKARSWKLKETTHPDEYQTDRRGATEALNLNLISLIAAAMITILTLLTFAALILCRIVRQYSHSTVTGKFLSLISCTPIIHC